jgi:hypothetical protein
VTSSRFASRHLARPGTLQSREPVLGGRVLNVIIDKQRG